MTRTLAEIREEEGKLSEAADILQEVQVEIMGSMEKKEKAEILLEQVRLTLDKKDFIRAQIILRKINKKILSDDAEFQVRKSMQWLRCNLTVENQDLNIKYYNLLVRFHAHNSEYLDICKAYFAMYQTSKVQSDDKLWKKVSSSSGSQTIQQGWTRYVHQVLRSVVVYLLLSPYSNEQNDLLHRVRKEKKLEELPELQ